MLRILRIVFAGIGFVLAIYGSTSQNSSTSPFMLLFLSLMMFVMGLEEFQKRQHITGWIFIVVFITGIYVAIQSFFYN